MLKDHRDIAFEKTAQKAEALAGSNLPIYKLKLVGYALLGYAVIFSILAALFGLVGGLIGMAYLSTGMLLMLLLKKKLILVLLPVIWVLIKALWVRFEAPSGYVVTAKEVPALFEELERLRRQLQAPKIHQVILTPELNASISQTPRLGIFGWQKNTLTLGLELLLVLSPEQTRAVIAHELGHLSGNHSRFKGWIYRARISWYNLMEAFQREDSWGAAMMRRFFDWYAPRFAAYSFALARSNEYEADAISAALTTPEVAGEALVYTHVTSPYIDSNYWDTFFEQADTTPAPAHGPWQGLHAFLQQSRPAAAQMEQMLQQELQQETGYANTHPALQDRLAALKVDPVLPVPVERTAALSWLGEQYQPIIEAFDTEWLDYYSERWQERYNYVQEQTGLLLALNDRDEVTLSDEQLWQKALLTEEFRGSDAAFAVYHSYQQRYPEDPDAAFVLGRMLYHRDDEALLGQLKLALGRPRHVIEACEYAYYYLLRHGRNEESVWWQQRAEEQQRIDAESEKERSELKPKDRLHQSSIDAEARQQILAVLQAHPKVKAAWLAEKEVKHYADVPALALLVKLKGVLTDHDKVAAEIADAMEADATFFVVPKTGDYKKLAKAIVKAGERIL